MNKSLTTFLISFIAIGICQSLMFSVLPLVLKSMAVAERDVSLVASMGALSFVVSCLVLAKSVQIYGSLVFFRIGIIVTVVCELVTFAALIMAREGYLSPYNTLYLLVFNRVVLNAAWGGYFSAGLVYAGGIVKLNNQARSIAAMGLAFAFGGMLGPFIASMIIKYSTVAPYLISSIFSLIAFLLLVSNKDILSAPSKEGDQSTFTRSALIHAAPHCLIAFGIIITLAMIQQTSAYFFQPYDTNTFALSVNSLSFLSTGLIMGQLIVIGISGSIRPLRYMLFGAVLVVISSAFFVSSSVLSTGNPTLLINITLIGFFGLGIGIILPNLGVATLRYCEDREKPFASSALNAAQGAGNIIGPLLGASMYQIDRLIPFSLTGIIMAVVILYCVSYKFITERYQKYSSNMS